MPGLVTATGVLALLADEEVELKVFALQTLNEDIDTVWFEVAPAVTDMYVAKPLLTYPIHTLAHTTVESSSISLDIALFI